MAAPDMWQWVSDQISRVLFASGYEAVTPRALLDHGDEQPYVGRVDFAVMQRPDPLEGRKWSLQAIILDGMRVEGVEDASAYIVLGTDGRAYGRGGCNRFSGSYDLTWSEIAFGPLASTRMYCEDTMRVEDAFFAALGLVRTVEVEQGTLVMRSEDWSVVLVFEELQLSP